MNTITKNPYVGPRTFLKEESHLYFGREREARDLTALVASERLVLFYAQSGAGKSSLLNTRLIPDLEKNNYEVFPIGRVSGGDLSLGDVAGNIYIYNLMRSLVQHEIDPRSIANLSLPQFLKKLDMDENGYFYDGNLAEITESEGYTPWRRALIIDQFEEVFSTHLDAWEKREDFFRQLAQAMQDDPYLWVVLVMREDYIAALDPYAHLMPGGLRTRYYMQRLSREAALKAMKNPVEDLRPYADGVAEQLVENLASIKVQKPGGKVESQPGQYVEPVQLQVVCYGLWENLSSSGTQITEKDLQEVGDVNQSLERYYDGRVSAVAKGKNIPERLIREWFEKELITSGGIRNMVLREEGNTSGLADDVIQTLQGDLVRAEMRAGQMWYELSHDRLIEPVLSSNAKWFEKHLKMFQRQAALWMQQGRSDGLLLRGRELQSAEREAKTLTLTRDEQTFLDACRVARNRARLINMGIAAQMVTIVILAIAMVFAFKARNTAIVSEKEALQAREAAVEEQAKAEQAKSDAVQAQKEAEKQAGIALAGSLAAQADSIKSSQHARALLLGLEAYNYEDNILTRTTLFNLLQFSPYTRLFGYQGPVTSIAVSPDGKIIATSSCREIEKGQCKYGEIILSDVKTHQPITKLSDATAPGDYFGSVNSLAFHQYKDKVLLAAGGCVPVDDQNKGCTDNMGEISIWDVTNADKPAQLADSRSGHKALVKTIAFNHAGTVLASGSFDTRIILWDVSDPSEFFMKDVPLKSHTSFVNSLAFSADDRTLVSAGDDKRILLWDVSGKNAIQWGSPIEEHTASVNSVAFSADGTQLASASDDHTVILWKWDSTVRKLQEPMKLEGHDGYVKSVAFSADGKILASAGFDNKAVLWDTSTGGQIGLPLNVHTRAINTLAFGTAETAEDLFTGSDDRTVIQWDLSTRKPLSQMLAKAAPPQGIVTATSGSLTASVDGQQIKLTGVAQPLPGHTGAINSLSFSLQKIDGRLLLVSASDDQTVILWDVSDPSKADVFLKLESFDNPVSAAYFEGTQLITVENSGRSIRWNIVPSEWVTPACNAAKRNLTQAEWDQYLPGQPYQKTCNP